MKKIAEHERTIVSLQAGPKWTAHVFCGNEGVVAIAA